MSDGSSPANPNTLSRAVAPTGGSGRGPGVARAPSMVLTTACPDTTGVVAAVASFLAANNCLITEAQHYDDPVSDTSFMRTVFHDNGHGTPSMQKLDEAFSSSVAQRFGMRWKFHEAQRKCRAVLAVSKHG